MTFKFPGAQTSLAALTVYLCLLIVGLFYSASALAQEPLLSFTAVSEVEPVVVDKRDARSAQQVHSVSALAYAASATGLTRNDHSTHLVLGPSTQDLKNVLLKAVEAAIVRSPQIQRAKAQQQATDADVEEAEGQRWPQVDLGSQTRAKQFGGGSEYEQSSGGVNLAVTTMVYDWGRVGKTIDSRKKLSTAAEESVAAENENISFEVVTTLVELGKQRIIVDLSQQFANRMEDLVKMLAGIVAVDQGRASELTQAKARLLQASALRDAAKAKAADARITLRKLLGELPVSIPRNKEWSIRPADLQALLEKVQNHPTIRQASAQAESDELQAEAVHASGRPQLNWVISKSTAEDSIGREQPWQTNLSVTWGLFRGGSTRAAERAALQRAEASRQEIAHQLQDLEFRLRTADNDARTQLQRAELYRDLSVESDRIRAAFFQQWHHLGKRSLLDVLTAESDHYNNQVNEVSNRFDGYQSVFREYATAGTLLQWLSSGR